MNNNYEEVQWLYKIMDTGGKKSPWAKNGYLIFHITVCWQVLVSLTHLISAGGFSNLKLYQLEASLTTISITNMNVWLSCRCQLSLLVMLGEKICQILSTLVQQSKSTMLMMCYKIPDLF